MSLCACMGPMYGEPHCICVMNRLHMPLNDVARHAEDVRAIKQMRTLILDFPFGLCAPYKLSPANLHKLVSRNKREGIYAGVLSGKHTRTDDKYYYVKNRWMVI